jgi:hypothetical protein
MTIEALKSVIDYILETEGEDFCQNPSEQHIFYSAMILEWGEVRAKQELKEAQHEYI